MKKIIALLLASLMLLSVCGCGLEVENIAPTPESAPVQSAESAEAPAPVNIPEEVTSERWQLAGEKNEYAAILEYFGTSVRDGAQMELKSDGRFSWYMGATGGEGVWSEENGQIQAKYTSYNDPHEYSLLLERTDGYMLMHTGEISVWWKPVETDSSELYSAVLDKYYQALNESWDAETLLQNGVSFMLIYLSGDKLSQLGYGFRDLDGDGCDELFIVSADLNSIYAIYTFSPDSGNVILLAESGERYFYSLKNNNSLYFYGSNSAYEHIEALYRLENSELREFDTVIANYMENENEPYTHNGVKIGNADAEAILSSYIDDIIKLDGCTLFSQYK